MSPLVPALRAAAPFVGSAVKNASFVAGGIMIANRATRFAHRKAEAALDDLSLAREAVRDGDTDTVTQVQEQAS